jgi:hypothetical protein
MPILLIIVVSLLRKLMSHFNEYKCGFISYIVMQLIITRKKMEAEKMENLINADSQ